MSTRNEDAASDFMQELDTAARRVRELDPTCSSEAVARFLREIADAEAALDTLPFDELPAPIPFSPIWEEEGS